MPRVSRAVSMAALAFSLSAFGAISTASFDAAAATAEREPIVVWPTLSPAGDAPSREPLRRPAESEVGLFARAQELDATLRDAVQDLGLSLQVADPGPAPGHARDLDMIERAERGSQAIEGDAPGGTWVVSPRIESAGGDQYLVRIVVVPPKGHELRVRLEKVRGSEVAVRGLVMLRGLLTPPTAGEPKEPKDQAPRDPRSLGLTPPARSPGRAVLAMNTALFGAYVAYSIQRASGSDDPRVLYPLLALGTGIGVGSALLVAEEWDVRPGEAWFISAGAWWGAGSGLLLASGREVKPLSDRYTWGVCGGIAGITLATATLAAGHVDDGGAALTHSGAALGMFLGGVSELLAQGSLDATPASGAGIGTALGLIGAGALATQIKVSPSRVFLVDLGVGVGALAGAALASPLLLNDVTKPKSQAFLIATMAGTLAGGTVATLLTRDATPPSTGKKPGAALYHALPMGGVIGSSETRNGPVPAYGIGVVGTF